jgi:hypothetical protein
MVVISQIAVLIQDLEGLQKHSKWGQEVHHCASILVVIPRL